MWKNSLCNYCAFLRTIQNERGSLFYMCQKSKENAHFPKYPHQPILRCVGFAEKEKPPQVKLPE